MRARARLSIRTRLTLVVSALILALGAASSIAAYLAVRHAAIEATRQRLSGATGQLRAMLESSVSQMTLRLDSAATLPAVQSYFGFRNAHDSARARAALDSIGPSGSNLDMELWDVRGHRLLASRANVPEIPPAGIRETVAMLPSDSSGFVTPFRIENDSVDFAVVVPIRRDGVRVGFLALRSRLRGTPGSVERLRGLIGSEAVLLVGNTRGDVWTDLAAPAAGPPISVAEDTAGLLEYEGPRGDWKLAAPAMIAGTPWTVLLEFPRAPVLAGARAVAVRIALITLGLVALGLIAAWLLSRSLARPLRHLADAAEAIAAGDYGRRVTVTRQDETGTVAAAFNDMAATVQDMHERLEAQVEERTEELANTVRELEAFSYSVSHDLRAPLRSIDGFSLALLEDHEEHLDDQGRDYLKRVRSATQRMAALIDDLLSLSRITRAEMEWEAVDLSALATEILDELAEAHPERGVETVVASDLTVHGDRRLLRHALVNLLSNAFKFTGKRRDARIEVGVTSDGAEAVYFVRDNGVGFDMQYASKLFGAFQRLHSVDEFEGTGIGLATVQRVIHRHGGRIWAESAVGHGTTFRFTLRDAHSNGGGG